MPRPAVPDTRRRGVALILLTVVYGFNFIDRQIVGILAPFIQKDLELTNTELGLLIGLAFATFYTLIAIPIAWLADRYNRVNILATSLAVWSAFTALTGLAGNFAQIGLARMGVGIGEAGGSPPSHSIISDLYAKHERAGALGVYAMGIPLGVMSAYFATAWLMGAGDDVNWRKIFIVLGITGVALALVVKVVLPEPVRGAMESAQPKTLKKASLTESFRHLLKIPAWWAMCIGIAMGSFVSYSFSAFQTKYLGVLDPDFSFRTLVILLGVINGTTYAAGAFLGARIADKWGAKNVRAYGLLPAIAISICLPITVLCFWVSSVWAHLALATILLLFLGVYLGPSFAIAQTLAPINMRAISTALFFFILNMIALGGGPTFSGWMMDVFRGGHGELESIRYAMTVTCVAFIPSILSFLLVARFLPRDWKRAEDKNQA